MSQPKQRKEPTPIKPAKTSGTIEEVVEGSANYALNLLAEAAKHRVWLNVPWAGVLTALAHADDEVCAVDDCLVDYGLEPKARFDNLVKGCGKFAADTMVEAGLYLRDGLQEPPQNTVGMLNRTLTSARVGAGRRTDFAKMAEVQHYEHGDDADSHHHERGMRAHIEETLGLR
jgi:hypothetical protein